MKKIDLHSDPKITSGFKVPDGYFEDFSKKMMTKLPASEVKVISFYSNRSNWIFAAAAVFVIAMSIPIYKTLNRPTLSLDQPTIENYIANNIPISDAEFAALLDEEDIQNIQVEYDIENQTIEDLFSVNPNLHEYIIN